MIIGSGISQAGEYFSCLIVANLASFANDYLLVDPPSLLPKMCWRDLELWIGKWIRGQLGWVGEIELQG